MAFGKSIMSRFSDDIEVLDPAYEGLYDSDETELDAFLKIACEGSEPWCEDCDDDEIIYDDDIDEDDEDYDEEDDDDEDDDDDVFYDEDEECCVENAITDATPEEKRRRFFNMVDKNPKFSPEQKKQIKANYDAKHGGGEAKESAADYTKAMKMIHADDERWQDDVDEAYDYSSYDDEYLDEHAEFSANLGTGYTRLNEKNTRRLNNFQGDDEAKYAANLHTSYSRARENAYDYEEIEAMAEKAFENAVYELNAGRPMTEYEHMASEHFADMDIEMNSGLENCKSALESMLADLDSIS